MLPAARRATRSTPEFLWQYLQIMQDQGPGTRDERRAASGEEGPAPGNAGHKEHETQFYAEFNLPLRYKLCPIIVVSK